MDYRNITRITDLDMHGHMLDQCDNVNKIMISVIWPNRNLAYSIYPSLDRDGYRIDLLISVHVEVKSLSKTL